MVVSTNSLYFILYLPVQLPLLLCFFLPLSPSLPTPWLFLEARELQGSIFSRSGGRINFPSQPSFLLLEEMIQACPLLLYLSLFPWHKLFHTYSPNLSVCSFPTHGKYLPLTSFHFWSISWQVKLILGRKCESCIRHSPPSATKKWYRFESKIMIKKQGQNLSSPIDLPETDLRIPVTSSISLASLHTYAFFSN